MSRRTSSSWTARGSSAAAARVSFLARRGRVATSSDGDLIAQLSEGDIDWDAIDAELLPEDVQGMDPPERRTYLEDQLDRRRGLLSEVAYYSVQRDQFLDEASQPLDAFQRQIVQALGFDD